MATPTRIKALDKVFSLYVRARDSKDGYFTCCSCGVTKSYDKADAGHFINRRFMATRWREDNVHAQCSSCNRFSEGDAAGYAIFMIRKYGLPHVELLQAIKNETMKYTDWELKELEKIYRQKLKDLTSSNKSAML